MVKYDVMDENNGVNSNGSMMTTQHPISRNDASNRIYTYFSFRMK